MILLGIALSVISNILMGFKKVKTFFSILWVVGVVMMLIGMIDVTFFDDHYKRSNYI